MVAHGSLLFLQGVENMGMLKFGGEGTWHLSSEKDSRWNCSGRGLIVASSGYAEGANEKIELLKKAYGKQPDDLELTAIKD